MVDGNRVEGALRDVGGRIQDAAGRLTGDTSTRARGQANQAAGAAQNLYGQAVDGARELATDQPLAALLAALGAGVLIGWLFARR